MSKWGTIPNDIALTSLLVELSQRHYEGRWAVGITIYDQSHPGAWALGRRILRHHALQQGNVGWASLTKRLTGLTVASMEETRRRNAEARWAKERAVRSCALDDPVERLGSSEWRQAADSRQGLLVIERWREVKRWNPTRLRYEVIGKQKVYEVK